MEKIQLLEQKITKAIDKIKAVTEENRELNAKISELQKELNLKTEELVSIKDSMKDNESLQDDLDKLTSEREAVKSQVENLLKELESVEL